MADVVSTLRGWSATESANLPSGTSTIGTGLDENLRTIQAVIRKYMASVASSIASTATVDLSAADGFYVQITVTDPAITSFGTESAGIHYLLRFAGAVTLTHNSTTLILPGAANVVTAAGDMALMISEGSGNWRCVYYVPAAYAPGVSGVALVANALKSLTTSVNTSSATAPSVGQVLMATGSAAATWQTLGASGVYTNVINVFTKNQSVAPVVLTPGSTVSVDASLSNNFTLVPAQNFTLSNPTNLTDGMVLNFRFKQDGTGTRVATWGSKYTFPGGTDGVLSTPAASVDFMSAYYDSTDDKLICVLNKAFA